MAVDLKNLLEKLNNGTCSKHELELLSKELQGEKKKINKILEQNWQHSETEQENPVQKHQTWKELNALLTKDRKLERVNKFRKFPIYAAAAVVLIIGSILTWQLLLPSQANTENVITFETEKGEIKSFSTLKELEESSEFDFKNGKLYLNKSSAKNQNPEELVYTTLQIPHGEKLTLVFSDNSEVILNSGSSIKYPPNFISGLDREVYLIGEAYFQVTHNPADTFKVHLPNTTTKVLGTSFNINAYPEASEEEIVLVEGKVKVMAKGEELNLKPNQKAEFSKKKAEIGISEVNSSDYLAWIEGFLIFKNESFANIIPQLERKYDVQIETSYSDLLEEKFTGKFQNENIEEVLETFQQVKDFEIQKINKKYIINPKKEDK